MKTAWIILLISAMTDFGIVVSAGIASAMVATGDVSMPSAPVIILNVMLASGAALRTIQQALKNTPETAAALKGAPSITATTTIEKTP